MTRQNSKSIELDMMYQLHVDQTEINSFIGHKTNYTIKSLTWLDRLLLYFPTWIPISVHGKPRNKCLSIMILLSIIIWTIYAWCYCGIIDIMLNHDMPHMFKQIKHIIFYTMRIMSVYYFYNHFNYPWYNDINKFKHKQQFENFCKSNIKFIKTIVCISAANIIIVRWMFIAKEIHNYTDLGTMQNIFVNIMFPIFNDIPLTSLLAVQAIIFLKYSYYISEIICLMKENNDFSLQTVIIQYKTVYKAFKKEYHISFTYAMYCYFLLFVIQAWTIVYDLMNIYEELINDGVVYFIVWLCLYSNIFFILLVYIVPSIFLNETFETFQDLIWQCGSNNIENGLHIETELMYLIAYVQKDRICSRIGQIIWTKKNLLNMIVVFCIAKLISYSVAYLI
eukprot:291142_1